MFSSTWASSSSAPSTPLHPPPDAYDLAEEYGAEAAAKLSRILQALRPRASPRRV